MLATPVEYTTAWIHDLSTWKLKETVIVTDVGSTKGEIMKAAQALNKKRISFIGGIRWLVLIRAVQSMHERIYFVRRAIF